MRLLKRIFMRICTVFFLITALAPISTHPSILRVKKMIRYQSRSIRKKMIRHQSRSIHKPYILSLWLGISQNMAENTHFWVDLVTNVDINKHPSKLFIYAPKVLIGINMVDFSSISHVWYMYFCVQNKLIANVMVRISVRLVLRFWSHLPSSLSLFWQTIYTKGAVQICWGNFQSAMS